MKQKVLLDVELVSLINFMFTQVLNAWYIFIFELNIGSHLQKNVGKNNAWDSDLM